MHIIGFGHRKRVGKDTAAKFLQTHLRIGIRGKSVAKGNLAYALKKQTHDLWGWAGLREPEFYDTEEGSPLREITLQELGKTPRELWIEYGNKIREIFPDTWMHLQLHDAEKVMKLDYLILADIRYQNEVDIVRAAGGKVFKIIRDDAPVSNDVADSALDSFDGWDGKLPNNSSLSDFESAIKTMISDPLIKDWNDKKSS